MYWIIFAIISWLAAILIIKPQYFRHYWPAGLVTVLIVYLVDSTGSQLDAYKFYNTSLISGVPILYLLGAFPLGMITMYFYPQNHREQLAYVFILALLFLLPEFTMVKTGNFQHLSGWHFGKSYFLNLFGFIIITWTSSRLGVSGINQDWYLRILR